MPRIFPVLFVFLPLFFALPAFCGEVDDDGEAEERRPTVDDIPIALAKAQVGDWASYKTAEGKLKRLTVVERWNEHNDDHLVIQSTLERERKKRSTSSFEQVSVKDHIAQLRDLGPDDYLEYRQVLVNGKKIPCVVINYREDGVLVRQSYLSSKVPVYGLVRGVVIEGRNRTNVLTLEDYDFADDFE